MKKKVTVKSYYRKGRLVRASQRQIEARNKRKKLLKKVGIGVATVAGGTVVSYAALKIRYLNNLKSFAKKLKANPAVGEKLSNETKSITFTFGGFAGGLSSADSAVKKDDPLTQAKYLATTLKLQMPSKLRKENAFVPLDHKFTVSMKGVTTTQEAVRRRLIVLTTPVIKGYNPESQKLAQEIYSWHVKNPTKSINLVGFSAGGNLAKEVEYILKTKGIKTPIKILTYGTNDFRLVPPGKNSLDIVGSGDIARYGKNSKHKIVNVAAHDPTKYLTDKKTLELSYKYLYNIDYVPKSERIAA